MNDHLCVSLGSVAVQVVSLSSPGWSKTRFVPQAGSKSHQSSCLSLQSLRLQTCLGGVVCSCLLGGVIFKSLGIYPKILSGFFLYFEHVSVSPLLTLGCDFTAYTLSSTYMSLACVKLFLSSDTSPSAC